MRGPSLSVLLTGLGRGGVAARVVAGSAVGVAESVEVCGVTEDSRRVGPGWVFVARGGLRNDGRAHIGEAIAAGAVAVVTDAAGVGRVAGGVVVIESERPEVTGAGLAERFHGEPTSALELVGITGTNGKSTTAHVVHRMLRSVGVGCGLIGTIEIDDGVEVRRAWMTTPPAFEVSGLMRRMVGAGCGAAAMEVSSHSLEQGRVSALRFACGVFTNLERDHLDYHGTMEAYGAAKRRLFEMLPGDGLAVTNVHDARGAAMVAGCGRVAWCEVAGRERGAGSWTAAGAGERWVIRTERRSLAGMDVSIERGGGLWASGRVTMVGEHNQMNVLQAVVCVDEVLRRRGVGEAERRAMVGGALAVATAPAGRLEVVSGADDAVTVMVDYAHTPDAMRRAMGAVRECMAAGSRLTVVFGCGGDRDRGKRPMMGAAAAELADAAVLTSDNPRSERPGAIIDEVMAGIGSRDRGRVEVCEDRGAAIAGAVAWAWRVARERGVSGDVVLILGKGHETEQIVAGEGGGLVRLPFDDRERARRAIAAASGGGRACAGAASVGQGA